MDWTQLDWSALDRLRDRFLRGTADPEPYWSAPADLASYDLTYAERIGWKWDHALRELRVRGWHPESKSVLDWGCGSGVAGRRVIRFFGAENFTQLTVWDHSPLAGEFSAAAAERDFPRLSVRQATPGYFNSTEPIGLLVVSHVLNELPPNGVAELRALLDRAEEVVWVEPGTSAVGRALGALRDELRSKFRVIAPCTHEEACPQFSPGRERDWCHFFAAPPAEIFADSNWVKFGQRAGIDLRSLPYSFLTLDRRRPSQLAPGASHIIGRPEHFKPYVRWLDCSAAGFADLELPKRADPALFKQMDRTRAPLVYWWRRNGDKVETGHALSEENAAEGSAPATGI